MGPTIPKGAARSVDLGKGFSGRNFQSLKETTWIFVNPLCCSGCGGRSRIFHVVGHGSKLILGCSVGTNCTGAGVGKEGVAPKVRTHI